MRWSGESGLPVTEEKQRKKEKIGEGLNYWRG